LKKRFEALSAHPLYHGMEFSDDKKQIQEWIPLVMEGRDPSEEVAATRKGQARILDSLFQSSARSAP
jgi:malate dehydrogenase (quinone)